LAYDRLVFNGLLFIWDAFKKWRAPLVQVKKRKRKKKKPREPARAEEKNLR
jgi:hypothetical protein